MVEDATNNALAAPSTPQPHLGITASPEPSDTPHALAPADPGAAADAPKPKASKRKHKAMSMASRGMDTAVVGGDEPMPVVTPKRRRASKKSKAAAGAQDAESTPGEAGKESNAAARAQEVAATPGEAVAAAVEAVTSDDGGKVKKKRQRVKASEVAVNTEVELLDAPAKGNLCPVHFHLVVAELCLIYFSILFDTAHFIIEKSDALQCAAYVVCETEAKVTSVFGNLCNWHAQLVCLTADI